MLDGEFDVSNAARFERAIDDALNSGRLHLIVDLRGVSLLDSRMLLALIRALKQARGRDAELALVHPNPHVWRVFVLTSLSERFLVFRELADAVAALESRSSSNQPEPVL
jgi:anti-sigma B factor antagonist